MVKEGINNTEKRYWVHTFVYSTEKGLESVSKEYAYPYRDLDALLEVYLFSISEKEELFDDSFYGFKMTLEMAEFGVDEPVGYPDECYTFTDLESHNKHKVVAERSIIRKDGNSIRTEKVFDAEIKEAIINFLKGIIEEDTDLLHRIENA